ncbi:Hypothetical_protein [Hexamita inflata]|uniref:Hypothetical_protein n=1 Tax=Hexamita inflata TaxID=28002 RepID=A0ABP1J4N1_9EUKA
MSTEYSPSRRSKLSPESTYNTPMVGNFAESQNEVRYLRYLQKLAEQTKSGTQSVQAGEMFRTVSDQLKKHVEIISKFELQVKAEAQKNEKLTMENERLKRELSNLQVTFSGTQREPADVIRQQKAEIESLKAHVGTLQAEIKQHSQSKKQFEILENKDYAKLASAYRTEKMQHKLKTEQLQKMVHELRKQKTYLEKMIPESQRTTTFMTSPESVAVPMRAEKNKSEEKNKIIIEEEEENVMNMADEKVEGEMEEEK